MACYRRAALLRSVGAREELCEAIIRPRYGPNLPRIIELSYLVVIARHVHLHTLRARHNENNLCSKSRAFISAGNCSRIVSLPRGTESWLFRFAARISTEVLIKPPATVLIRRRPSASRFVQVSGLVFHDSRLTSMITASRISVKWQSQRLRSS